MSNPLVPTPPLLPMRERRLPAITPSGGLPADAGTRMIHVTGTLLRNVAGEAGGRRCDCARREGEEGESFSQYGAGGFLPWSVAAAAPKAALGRRGAAVPAA